MNRFGNVLRAVAFLLSGVIGVGIFGGFAAWAVSGFDPATQEVIGLVGSPPWLGAVGHPKLALTQAGSVVDRGATARPASPWVTRRP